MSLPCRDLGIIPALRVSDEAYDALTCAQSLFLPVPERSLYLHPGCPSTFCTSGFQTPDRNHRNHPPTTPPVLYCHHTLLSCTLGQCFLCSLSGHKPHTKLQRWKLLAEAWVTTAGVFLPTPHPKVLQGQPAILQIAAGLTVSYIKAVHQEE